MADGTITLETKADEKGVKVGMKEIEASVKRMSSSVEGLERKDVALQKQLDSLSKLNNQYGLQEQKVEALRKRLKELSDQKVRLRNTSALGLKSRNWTMSSKRWNRSKGNGLIWDSRQTP